MDRWLIQSMLHTSLPECSFCHGLGMPSAYNDTWMMRYNNKVVSVIIMYDYLHKVKDERNGVKMLLMLFLEKIKGEKP